MSRPEHAPAGPTVADPGTDDATGAAVPSRVPAYLADGPAIYERSFAIIRDEADLAHLPPDAHDVAVRMIHSCGMVDLAADMAISPGAAGAARAALRAGAPILCDAAMVASGVTRRFLPAGNDVVCTLHAPEVPALAAAASTTRSAAAMELWRPLLDGAVVAIGNAPTSLFRLLELVEQGAGRPAAVLGLPVGFVGAAESKAALVGHPSALEHVVVHGRRGGSAMTVGAINALALGAGGGDGGDPA